MNKEIRNHLAELLKQQHNMLAMLGAEISISRAIMLQLEESGAVVRSKTRELALAYAAHIVGEVEVIAEMLRVALPDDDVAPAALPTAKK